MQRVRRLEGQAAEVAALAGGRAKVPHVVQAVEVVEPAPPHQTGPLNDNI